MTIKTERLLIDMLDPDDVDLLWELDQDPAVMKYINGGRASSREEIEQKLIPRLKKYHNSELGWGLWKIHEQASGEYLGWILVRPMFFFSSNRDDKNIELGWRLKQKTRGKGIGTEAARAVMAHVNLLNQPSRFSAIVNPDNKASIRIMEKLGMAWRGLVDMQDPMMPEPVTLL